jgi:hypothetical protein
MHKKLMVERCKAAPEQLSVEPPVGPRAVSLQRLKAEVDELWSFIDTKANRHWVWITMDATTRQVLAFPALLGGVGPQVCSYANRSLSLDYPSRSYLNQI